MTTHEALSRPAELIERLLDLWEASVRATHMFLSEEDIRRIRPQAEAGLMQIPTLIVAGDDAAPAGFMGIAGDSLEMLFLAPAHRGKGLGRKLLERGIRDHGVKRLCVNEQHPAARSFYERMGFEVHDRSPHDEQGNPFPLLHMRLKV